MYLLCGIYVPNDTDNSLFLNKKNWRDFSAEAWKSFFSITPQDGFLFSKTIEENILLDTAQSLPYTQFLG